MPLRRNILITSLLALALSQGCLYIAPIDEDPEPEDTPPFVNALNGVSPSMGLVNINLSLGGNQEFVISGYGDANLDQTLYHRIVIDYRTAGVAANPVYSIVPKRIEPNARDRITYSFPACTAAISYPTAIADGKQIELYLVIADAPFMHASQLFSAMNFQQPFETETGRSAVWVQWTLQFIGSCPESP